MFSPGFTCAFNVSAENRNTHIHVRVHTHTHLGHSRSGSVIGHLWIELCVAKTSCAEALTSKVLTSTVLGERAFKEVIQVK